MILELGPRNTDSDHQRDRRQRHTDGAGSTVQLPIRNHPGSPQSSPGLRRRRGCGIAYIQDTAQSRGRRIISCVLLQRDISVVTSRLRTPARTCAPRQLPKAFPAS